MKKTVAIVDYGLGNLFNIKSALEANSISSIVTSNKDEILKSSHLILPGVGSFKEGMDHLINRDLINTLINFKVSGKPILGICLGMQLLMSKSFDDGEFDGLNFIEGEVTKLKKSKDVRVPNIGWGELSIRDKYRSKESLLKGVVNNTYMYFLHSYHVEPNNSDYIMSETKFGNNYFCSSINKEIVYGCQFHPEFSATDGLSILKNFITI